MQPLVRTRTSLAALASAGLLFAAYPLVRPYTDETTMAGARAMASSAWVAAHSFAILGFVLLVVALPDALAHSGVRRATNQRASLVAGLGAGLVLPYYGAETFGLHAIGQEVVARNDLGLLALTNSVRYQPIAIAAFGVGLVLLATAGGMIGVGLWQSGGELRSAAVRWGGVLVAAGLVLFLPQFFAPAPLRIGHGLLMALGCVVLAVSGWRRRQAPPSATVGQLTGEPPVTPSISAVM